VDQWFYKRSAIMRVLEEGGVHTYGTRNPLSGAAWPFRGGYSLAPGRADPIAAALLAATGYSTYKVGEAVYERVMRPDDSE